MVDIDKGCRFIADLSTVIAFIMITYGNLKEK